MSYSNKKSVIKRVLFTVKKHRIFIFLSILFTVLSVSLSLYIPILAGKAIDSAIGKDKVNFDIIVKNIFAILIFAGLSAILQWIISLINNRIAYKTVTEIRENAFSHLNKLPLSYIDSHPYGDIVSRLTSDADQFTDGLLLGFSQLFNGVITVIITLVFMLFLSPVIAIVVVVLTPISLFIAKYIASKTYKLFKKQSEIRGEQTAFITEMISNQKTVQAFSYEEKSCKKFDFINGLFKECSVKAIFFSSLTNPTTRFVNNIIYAVVGLTGAVAAIKGALTVGGFVSFLSYANQYTKPFNEISGVVTELQNALACAGRIFELMDIPTEESDADAINLSPNIKGEIAMEKVSFSYDKNRPLLTDVSINVSSGKKIAIVGPTGCGKTTLINLLMRFYDVDKGAIKLDGADIKDIKRESLRISYGMVLQDTWLKNGTIRDNIAYGNENATDDEIISVAKSAHAHSFIKRLPDGYNTIISDDGGSLSQGERQLLCIARVMLCNPKILILDEATSSIDTMTEQKVQDAFHRLIKGKTSFVVAHRLSTVLDADLILVMKDGNIIEQGTHNELLARNGFYKELYNSQFVI